MLAKKSTKCKTTPLPDISMRKNCDCQCRLLTPPSLVKSDLKHISYNLKIADGFYYTVHMHCCVILEYFALG